jgi:hypothetical protein
MGRTKGSKSGRHEALGLIGFLLLYQPGHVAVVRTCLLLGGLCCRTHFVSPNTDFPGRGCGKRILMWGTTSFCDELTDDFGDAFEATPIDDCRLFCV